LLVWQGSQINPFCVADSYDQKGLHIMAAVVRCDIGFIRQHFDTDAACIEANTMVVQAPEPPPPPAPTPTLSIPDTHIQQEARIEAGQRDAARKAAVKRAYVQQTIEELQNDNDPEE
jgi:hypothetical protein